MLCSRRVQVEVKRAAGENLMGRLVLEFARDGAGGTLRRGQVEINVDKLLHQSRRGHSIVFNERQFAH